MTRKVGLHGLLFLSLIAMTTACQAGRPSPRPTAVPSTPAAVAAATATPAPPSPTPAPAATATLVVPPKTQATATLTPLPAPTASPVQAAAPTPAPVRVQFAPGTTSAVLTGNLPAHGTARYILRAMANQVMQVDVSPPEGLALFVTGVDGKPLRIATQGTAGLRGIVPRTQDYVIQISAGAQPIAYSLDVVIPALVRFAPGATSATVQGRLAAHGLQYYVVSGQADQLLEVELPPQQGIGVAVYGIDGTVLQSPMGGLPIFRGTLPSSQDYILALAAQDGAVSYTMNVIIPIRIQFAPGATSATIQGRLAAQETQHYVLHAMANQLLQVTVTPERAVRLTIYGVDGTVLRSGMGGASTFSGRLPSTQDYLLDLSAGSRPVAYTLSVSIP
jgi:hypothetical protein